ncbi:hypothetical protein Rs2_38519 [Raphanus sativus]|nr:hypothetical protein Rs2_38519 [Raphanus sativus]
MEKFGFDGSCFAVGSSISVIGGFQDWNIMSSVSLIDCGSHTAQVGGFGHAVIDCKIYTSGGSDEKRYQSIILRSSNLGPLKKPSIQALIHGSNRHYYSIAINYRKNKLDEKIKC